MSETEIDVWQIRPSITAYQIIGVNSSATQDTYLTLSGTANEISITPSGTTLTLSTPQAIATTSSPTFSATTVTNLYITLVSSDPVSPTEGQIWYNSTSHQLLMYNGTTNVVLG
jgi:hypothetical protein